MPPMTQAAITRPGVQVSRPTRSKRTPKAIVPSGQPIQGRPGAWVIQRAPLSQNPQHEEDVGLVEEREVEPEPEGLQIEGK